MTQKGEVVQQLPGGSGVAKGGSSQVPHPTLLSSQLENLTREEGAWRVEKWKVKG